MRSTLYERQHVRRASLQYLTSAMLSLLLLGTSGT